MIPLPPRSTLFPYTTLFRSQRAKALLALAPGFFRAGLLGPRAPRSEEHTSELQSLTKLVCRLLLEKKNRTARKGAFGLLCSHSHSQLLSICRTGERFGCAKT